MVGKVCIDLCSKCTVVDLCCGLKGFSQAFADAGWKVVTVDIEPKFNPTVIADITAIDWLQFKRDYLDDKSPDVLLASPPCERFSIACPEWPKKGIKKAMEVVGACFEAVTILKPKYWLIENPRGRLRWFLGTPKQTIRYSDFDLSYPVNKLTDLWGNIPLPMVKHERPIHTGHFDQGWMRKHDWGYALPRNAKDRAKIPLGVSQAVFEGATMTTEKGGKD